MALRDDTGQKFRHRQAGEGTLLVSGTTANDASGNPRWSLYALDTKKGKQRWVLDLPDVPGRMVQANGIAYLVYGTSSIMAVNTESGLMIWQQQIPARKQSPTGAAIGQALRDDGFGKHPALQLGWDTAEHDRAASRLYLRLARRR